MKTKIIIINTFALFFILFEGYASAKTLSEVLGQFCVPKTGEYCSNAYAAKYNKEKNICECKNPTYLKYDSVERHCEINCSSGHIPLSVSHCPEGYFQMQIVDHS